MTSTYHCPISGAAFEIDTDVVSWDDDGNAVVNCDDLPSHEITIAKPVSAGFGGGDAA